MLTFLKYFLDPGGNISKQILNLSHIRGIYHETHNIPGERLLVHGSIGSNFVCSLTISLDVSGNFMAILFLLRKLVTTTLPLRSALQIQLSRLHTITPITRGGGGGGIQKNKFPVQL